MTAARLRPLVGDLRQLASVRRLTFDDGPERGVEAVLMIAGPLMAMILPGRAMDIGALHWRGLPVGWTSPAGHTAPALHAPEQDGMRGFDRIFSGFLMTGGLSHSRQPRGGQPLHGRLPFAPARLIGAGEDWDRGLIWCEGEMRETRYGGETLLLRRRIEMPLNGSALHLRDRLSNDGMAVAHPQLLYHVNFGYPAVGAQSVLRLDGQPLISGLALPETATAPSTRHAVSAHPVCRLETGSFAAEMAFSGETLPVLQLWRDLRPRAGVFSVEPCSGPPDAPHPALAPGEHRDYALNFRFSGDLADP